MKWAEQNKKYLTEITGKCRQKFVQKLENVMATVTKPSQELSLLYHLIINDPKNESHNYPTITLEPAELLALNIY